MFANFINRIRSCAYQLWRSRQSLCISIGVLSLIVLCILFGLIVSPVFFLIGPAIFCISAYVVRDVHFVGILFFLMPFAMIFKYHPNYLSLFTLCEVMAVLILFFQVKILSRRNFSFIATVGVYAIYLLIGVVRTHNFELDEYIKQIMNVLLLFYIISVTVDCEKKRDTLGAFYTGGILVSSVVGLFGERIPHFYEFVRKIGYNPQITNRFTGLNGDPNFYAINIILALLFLLMCYRKNKCNAFVFWGGFAVFSLFGMMTYSKSFLVMYALFWGVLCWQSICLRKKCDIIFCGTAVIAVVILAIARGSYVNIILERLLGASDASSLTTGRSDIWIPYFKAIFGSALTVLFGYGFGAPWMVVFGENGSAPHCMYIDLLYLLGVIGSVIIVAMYVNCIRCSSISGAAKRNLCAFNFLGWAMLALMCFFLSTFYSGEMVFQIYIAYSIFAADISKLPESGLKNIGKRLGAKIQGLKCRLLKK